MLEERPGEPVLRDREHRDARLRLADAGRGVARVGERQAEAHTSLGVLGRLLELLLDRLLRLRRVKPRFCRVAAQRVRLRRGIVPRSHGRRRTRSERGSRADRFCCRRGARRRPSRLPHRPRAPRGRPRAEPRRGLPSRRRGRPPPDTSSPCLGSIPQAWAPIPGRDRRPRAPGESGEARRRRRRAAAARSPSAGRAAAPPRGFRPLRPSVRGRRLRRRLPRAGRRSPARASRARSNCSSARSASLATSLSYWPAAMYPSGRFGASRTDRSADSRAA